MGGPELLIVAIVAIIVIFGVNKLPQIARNVGKAQNEFKKGLKEGAGDVDAPATPMAPPAASAPVETPPPAQPPTQGATPTQEATPSPTQNEQNP